MSARLHAHVPVRGAIAAALMVVGVLIISRALIVAGLSGSPSSPLQPPGNMAPPSIRPGQRGPASLILGVDVAPSSSDSVIAYLSIPRLGLTSVPIFDRGLDAHANMVIAPGFAVTHYQFSAPFGTGNAVLYGHDDIDGSVFNHLSDLRAGDEIDVVLVGSTAPLVYQVATSTVVAPSAVQILQSSGASLTLFTCWPTWIDTQRYVVTARPAG
jgi:LPXTG-site transpeptidase (sortase) family protein